MPRSVMAILATVMVVALAILATVQYRWIGQISAAEEQRGRATLEGGSRRFSDDVNREVMRIHNDFQRTDSNPRELARRFEEWSAAARDPLLVRAIYLGQPDGSISRLDPDRREIVPAGWPPELRSLRFVEGRRPPLDATIPAIVLPMRPPPPDHRPDAGPDFAPPPEPRGLLIVQIDRQRLRALFDELASRHFTTEDDVAVIEDKNVVYRTAAWPPDASAHGEAEAPLLVLRAPPPGEERGPEPQREQGPPRWRVVVRRHGVPLSQSVKTARHRNLAISAGILLLLAGSFALLVALMRRTDKLRRQQLEFVAGITHELNTPLAAITSAGQNLADGIVADPGRVAQYGSMIARDARRLSDTVAQVLAFAGLQGRASNRTEAVDVSDVIGEAVTQCRWLADEAEVAVEPQIERQLPLVDADPIALTAAVQNLIANAIKHGGAGGWVGVRATRDVDSVVITVEDRGPGVSPREARHLFEPFYRGRGAARVRGSGLGLAIVRQVAKQHGGSVSVARRREGGAAFALRIPLHMPAEATAG